MFVQSLGICILEKFFKNRMRCGVLIRISVVELAAAPRIGIPDVNSRAEIVNTQGIRQRSAHTDDEGRLLWMRHNLSHLWRLHRPAIWRILPKRKMAATFMIILEVRNDVVPERGLVQDYDVVETLSSDRADQPFDVWTLPRRPECGEHFCYFHAFGLCPEGGTINAVAIPE